MLSENDYQPDVGRISAPFAQSNKTSEFSEKDCFEKCEDDFQNENEAPRNNRKKS